MSVVSLLCGNVACACEPASVRAAVLPLWLELDVLLAVFLCMS
jgi:hypothetical protein